MTIKVTIKNEDSRETAVIAVCVWQRHERDLSRPAAYRESPKDLINPTSQILTLKGGESCEQYVHSMQDLHIGEVSQ